MIVAPSILSADFGNLEKSLTYVTDAEWLHIDVMDGHFVPNISIGPLVIKGIRKFTNQVFDTHLMIKDPMKYAKAFVEAGSDRITFHIEAVSSPLEVIDYLRELGVKVGVSIKPRTETHTIKKLIKYIDQVLVMSVEPGFGGQLFIPEALDKIKELDSFRKELNAELVIVVDGGINETTGKLCKEAGADVLVAGSYIFGSDNPAQKIQSLR